MGNVDIIKVKVSNLGHLYSGINTFYMNTIF